MGRCLQFLILVLVLGCLVGIVLLFVLDVSGQPFNPLLDAMRAASDSSRASNSLGVVKPRVIVTSFDPGNPFVIEITGEGEDQVIVRSVPARAGLSVVPARTLEKGSKDTMKRDLVPTHARKGATSKLRKK